MVQANNMIKTHCAICKSKEDLITFYPATFDEKKVTGKRFSARLAPDRMHYRFVRCKNCGLIFSNPIFPAGKINDLYKKSYFVYKKESEYLGKTYLKYFKEGIKSSDLSKLSVLDVGCGNGFFLEELQKIGIKKVYGVEPSVDSVK